MRTACHYRTLAAVAAVCTLLSPCHPVTRSPCHAFDEAIDSPMYKAPDLPVPRVVRVFPQKAKGLWLRALERPEAELRCRAAEAVALARRRGVKGLETTAAPLLAAVERADQDPAVVLAAAKALIALDARQAAPAFLRRARSGGAELRDVVEPALAGWQYAPAGTHWLGRLREPATPPRSLVLAVRGLAALREARAADRLRELVLSARTPGPVRLEAARALGAIRTDGLEKDAEGLAGDPSPGGTVARLAAAALVRRHKGDAAVRLLRRLAQDAEPAVAAPAVARLVEIDPKLVLPVLEKHVLASPDANVRSLGVDVLFREATAGRLPLLAARLDDPHPDVRVKARRFLHELAARKEFRERVIAEATRVLAAEDWRGQEQAAVLLTQLGHKPASGRLVALLESGKPEVFITAAWGLRRLDVRETLPAVRRYVEAELGRLLDSTPLPARKGVPPAASDHQLSQLNQFLGLETYAEADKVLRRFIPRPVGSPLGPEARAAALWALGLIHEGETVPDLEAALEERLNALTTIPSEYPQVRWMAAVALGQLRAKKALPSLRKYCPDMKFSGDRVHNACGWAVERITREKEKMAPPGTVEVGLRDWFLTPDE